MIFKCILSPKYDTESIIKFGKEVLYVKQGIYTIIKKTVYM